MAIGFIAGFWYLYHVRFAGGAPFLGLDHLRFGIVGMAASLIAMVGVSLATDEPDAETQAMVDAIRIPSGKTILDERLRGHKHLKGAGFRASPPFILSIFRLTQPK
jgi:hypothetical protein